MDLLKSKKKIKALTILERLNKHSRNEILVKYQESVALVNNLAEADQSLSALLRSTEAEIGVAISGASVSVEMLNMRYSYIESLHFAIERNKAYLKDMNSQAEAIKGDLISAGAKLDLASDKRQQELSIYRKDIEERCEAS